MYHFDRQAADVISAAKPVLASSILSFLVAMAPGRRQHRQQKLPERSRALWLNLEPDDLFLQL